MLVFFMYPLVFKFFYLRRLRNFSLPGLFLMLSCPFRTKGYQEMNQEFQEMAKFMADSEW